MPRNGSGSYSLPQAAFTPGTTISSAAVNSDFSDIASALTASIAADGQTPITGPLKQDAGALATPPWTFTGDTSAGIFLPATGKLGVVVGSKGIYLNSVAAAVTAATVAGAGSGYAVGDTITLTGGVAARQAVLQVATLSGSGVATVTVLDSGLYTTAPSNPVSQGSTSGSGSGATFNLTTASTSFAITNETGSALWDVLGASSYIAGAMGLENGLALATYIGASNIAAAVVTALPLPVPEGRLTPLTNTPVPSSDVSASTHVYWTPSQGLWTPIHNGSTLIPYQLAGELSFALSGTEAADQIYDIFLAYNNNVPVIGAGPSWSAGTSGSVTAGSCARGTGAGGTALARLLGFWTNAATINLDYSNGTISGTLSVAANQGLYLGTIYMDHTGGQISSTLSFGQNRKNAVWNMFNRVPIEFQVGDSTASWTYQSATIRASNATPAAYSGAAFNVGSGTTCNGCTVLTGLAEEITDIQFNQLVQSAAQATGICVIGVGLNSTTAFTGKVGQSSGLGTAAGTPTLDVVAKHVLAPQLGINVLAQLEKTTAAVNNTFLGTNSQMLMTVKYRG